MTKLSRTCQRSHSEVELPFTELFGSSCPVYDETLTECCGDEVDLNVLESASDINENVNGDWEWMQEYGDISVVLENCPGLYDRCININDICCKNDRQSVSGPTLAALNEPRALSPLIHPDMKRLHLVATETCEDKLEQFSESCRSNRSCLAELNRPIPKKSMGLGENLTSPQLKSFENGPANLRRMLLYGLNRPGALNSLLNRKENNLKFIDSSTTESNHVHEPTEEETPVKQEPQPEDGDVMDVQSEAESEPGSDASEQEDLGLNDEDSSGSEDNYDDFTTVKRIPGLCKRKRSEAEDWTPNPKKLLDIGKQLERLNKVINGLRPVGQLSVSAKNRTRREKNKLASRACRLKKKAGHEANKIKLFGLNQESKRLTDVLYDMKSLFIMTGDSEKRRPLFDAVNKRIKDNLDDQVSGRASQYVDSMLKKFASGATNLLPK